MSKCIDCDKDIEDLKLSEDYCNDHVKERMNNGTFPRPEGKPMKLWKKVFKFWDKNIQPMLRIFSSMAALIMRLALVRMLVSIILKNGKSIHWAFTAMFAFYILYPVYTELYYAIRNEYYKGE